MTAAARTAGPAIAPALRYHRGLDGLRGVAIVFVMVSHFAVARIAGGYHGVDIFYVLSGFLITLLLVQEHDAVGHVGLRRFYIRRFLRLGPALLLLLGIYVALGLLFGSNRSSYLVRAAIALFYLSNWVQTFELYDLRVLGHTWSLSAEEQFYLVWPWLLIALLRGVPRRGHAVALLLALTATLAAARGVAVLQGVHWRRIHYGLDLHADPLLLGAAVALGWSMPQWRERSRRHARLIAALALAGFVFLCLQLFVADNMLSHLRAYHLWRLAVIEAATALILWHLMQDRPSPLATFLGSAPLVACGRISYGLYLWHALIFRAVADVGSRYVDATQPAALAALIATAVTLTFAVSMVSYRLVEAPALRLKQRYA